MIRLEANTRKIYSHTINIRLILRYYFNQADQHLNINSIKNVQYFIVPSSILHTHYTVNIRDMDSQILVNVPNLL